MDQTKTSVHDSSSRAVAAAPGQMAVSLPAPVQFYKKSPIVPISTDYQTDNNNYALKDVEDNDEVYALNGATAPLYCTKGATTPYASNSKTADAYTPSSKFLHDCLHTAEEIMKQRTLKEGSVHSQSVETGKDFGVSEKSNWKVASGVDKGHSGVNTSVDVGESYAIVSDKQQDLGSALCQFHAAAVVAKDGSDNITMEVFGNPTKKKRDAVAKFSLYSEKAKSKRSFQAVWEGTFPGGITLAIGPK